MNGAIGTLLRPSAGPDDQRLVRSLFKETFHTAGGWKGFLDRTIPGQNVETLLRRSSAWWEVQNFQALYVACWIFHPVEKGSYMLRLDSKEIQDNVHAAYDRLLAGKKLQARVSSHLGKKGASAHEGWNFLQGYDELLVQLEGQPGGASYLFLKCEGHPMDGALSTMMHCLSWVVKSITGAGKTASAALHEFAQSSVLVEARAAENFGPAWKKLLGELGLSGKLVTIVDALDRLLSRCGIKTGVPPQIRGDSHLLGAAILGPLGYVKVFQREKETLKKKGVHFNAEVAEELTHIAERLVSTPASHSEQYFNEVRVTAGDLTEALRAFERHAT